MLPRIIHVIIFLIAFPSLIIGQPTIEDFNLIGDTYLTDDGCFRLTEEVDYRSGSLWYKKPIDLSKDFALELSVRLGCIDELGADGMVFVFTPRENQLGYVGEGIGFAGLVPSVGIEIDTYRNYHLNDPVEDHIAIMLNGRVGHRSDLVGPQAIPNIEDCTRHSFVIFWQANNQKLIIQLDQREIAAVQANFVVDIFGGNTQVYWGVTAATGRKVNIHEVCFNRLSYLPEEMKKLWPFDSSLEEKYAQRQILPLLRNNDWLKAN